QLARASLDQAVTLLQPRRELMDALVNLLIERETIEGAEFTVLVERHEQRDAGALQAAVA
ncbi:MAG: ATP-dependent zinc metalloprotease FtsH, partial [Cyanobacteriota bacterium]